MLYSLRSRMMAAFSILLIVPFTAMVYVLTAQSAKSIQQSIEVSTTQTIEQYASHIETLLTQIEDIGNQALSGTPTQDWLTERRNDESSPGEKMLAKQRLKAFFSSIAINNSNLLSIDAYTEGAGGIWLQDDSYLRSDWYRSYREGDIRWTGTHRDPDQPDESMKDRAINTFALPLVQLQSLRSEGVIAVNYPTELLLNPLAKIRFGSTGRAFLLDAEGASVLGQDEGALAGAVRDGRRAIEGRSDAGGFVPIRSGGVDYLLFYRTLPEQNWTVVGVVPEGELYVQIRRSRRTMLIVSGMLIVLAMAFAFGLSRGITRPLTHMASAMRQVRLGDFARALKLMPKVKRGHSELGFVADAFEQMTQRLKVLIETEFETNLRRKNAEYKALLLQINPHFYNNSLEIIGGLAATKRDDLVMDAVEALGRMMRYALKLDTDLVAVAEELAYIRDYLFILKLRYDDELDVSIDEDAAADGVTIAKFILQPLVENAVKYSMEKEREGPGRVELRSSLEAGRLLLRIADNGVGMPPDLAAELAGEPQSKDAAGILSSKGESIGLRNVLSRCRLQYGDAFRVEIDSAPGEGTAITLKLPARGGGDDV